MEWCLGSNITSRIDEMPFHPGKENNCWALAKLTMLEALQLQRNYDTRDPSEVLSRLLHSAWLMSQEINCTILQCLH